MRKLEELEAWRYMPVMQWRGDVLDERDSVGDVNARIESRKLSRMRAEVWDKWSEAEIEGRIIDLKKGDGRDPIEGEGDSV